MTGFSISTQDLGVSYGTKYNSATGLADLSLTLQPDTIHGLLGRNGTGKSTLLSVIAGLQRPTYGTVTVDGENPFESERLAQSICLVRESGDLLLDQKVSSNIRLAADLRPTFDQAYAHELMDGFGIDATKKMMRLSLGQRATAAALIGLATRAPLTLLDEVYIGMDSPTRRHFYDELLRDFVEHPRTIVLSSHLIDETERMLENVVLLRNNRLLLNENIDSLRERASTFSGPRIAIDEIAQRFDRASIVTRKNLGGTSSITVIARVDLETSMRANQMGLTREQVPFDLLFEHLTDRRTVVEASVVEATQQGSES